MIPTDSAIFQWSGWLFSAVGLVLAVLAERRARRDRRRSEQMVATLSRAYVPAPAGGPPDPGGEFVRSLLIRTATDHQPLSVAIARAKRHGVGQEAVTEAARELRRTKLLAFDEPLRPDTVISLNS